jgi:hypothetical protein
VVGHTCNLNTWGLLGYIEIACLKKKERRKEGRKGEREEKRNGK